MARDNSGGQTTWRANSASDIIRRAMPESKHWRDDGVGGAFWERRLGLTWDVERQVWRALGINLSDGELEKRLSLPRSRRFLVSAMPHGRVHKLANPDDGV